MQHISDEKRTQIGKIVEESRDRSQASVVSVVSTDGIEVSSSIREQREYIDPKELSAVLANYAAMYRAFEASRSSQNRSVSQGHIIIDQEESFTIIVEAGEKVILIVEIEFFVYEVDIEQTKKIAEKIKTLLG